MAHIPCCGKGSVQLEMSGPTAANVLHLAGLTQKYNWDLFLDQPPMKVNLLLFNSCLVIHDSHTGVGLVLIM